MEFDAKPAYVKILGRTVFKGNVLYLGFSLSGIEFEVTASKVEAILCTDGVQMEETLWASVAVFVDDAPLPSKRFILDQEEQTVVLYKSEVVRKVKIRLVKYSEAAFASVGIKQICTDTNDLPHPTSNKTHKVLFVGDSITCGYGIEGENNKSIFRTKDENPSQAYAALTASALDCDYQMVCWSGIGVVSSWTDTGDINNTFLMKDLLPCVGISANGSVQKKEKWQPSYFTPEVIVINLGTNDNSFTRQIPARVKMFEKAYEKLLYTLHGTYPMAQLVCVLGVMGQNLCEAVEAATRKFQIKKDRFRRVRLAKGRRSKSLQWIKVVTLPEQEEADGLGTDGHPSPITHKKVAQILIPVLQECLKKS